MKPKFQAYICFNMKLTFVSCYCENLNQQETPAYTENVFFGHVPGSVWAQILNSLHSC